MSHGDDAAGAAACYRAVMVQITYGVFQEADGSYAVSLRQSGTLGRVATGFQSQAEAQAWIDQDKWLENVDERSRPRGRAGSLLAEVRVTLKK